MTASTTRSIKNCIIQLASTHAKEPRWVKQAVKRQPIEKINVQLLAELHTYLTSQNV